MRFNTLTTRILAGLVGGIVLGALLPDWGLAAQPQLLAFADAAGGLWLDALRMTLIPLVFALLVVGVAQVAGTVRAGGFTGRVIAAILALLLISASLSAFAAPALLQAWPAPVEAAKALRASALGVAKSVPAAPPFSEWIRGFVPANPIKAASDGAMGSIVVFALVFGFAAASLAEHRRDALYRFFDAVQAAMMRIVEWVLWAGPVGVFFLALGVGAKTGFGAIGLLGHYVAVVSAVCVLSGLLGVATALIGGRTPPGALGAAMIAPSAMAISTQSSLASLPVMLEAARRLGIHEQARGLVLPMAVALFRITSPAANLAVAIYSAHVFGIALDPARLAAGVVVAALVSLATVGVPSTVTFFTNLVPIFIAMGLPMDLLPLFIAVETFPDFFRTLGNVWADVGLAAWADRWMKPALAAVAPEPATSPEVSGP